MILNGLKLQDSSSSLKFGTSLGSFEGFLYQIWWHGSVSTTIKALTRELIVISDHDCATFYVFIPFKICLSSVEDPNQNRDGVACSSTCSNLGKSCRSDGSCIQGCNISCSNPTVCRTYDKPSCSRPKECEKCIKSSDYCLSCKRGYKLNSPENGICIIEEPYCVALDSLSRCSACKAGYYLNSNNPPTSYDKTQCLSSYGEAIIKIQVPLNAYHVQIHYVRVAIIILMSVKNA